MSKQTNDLSKNLSGSEIITDSKALVASYATMPVTVDCVIFGFINTELKILVYKSKFKEYDNQWSLLGNVVQSNENFDDAAYRVLKQYTSTKNIYLQQVKTFSNPNRHPGGRVATVAYCSLINISNYNLNSNNSELHWVNVRNITEMAFDHKEILDACHHWLQKMIQEDPLALNLLPEKFSLRTLQNVYEAIWGVTLDRRNFRKKFASMKLLDDTGLMEEDVPHRPGKLYKFNFAKYNANKRNWLGVDF